MMMLTRKGGLLVSCSLALCLATYGARAGPFPAASSPVQEEEPATGPQPHSEDRWLTLEGAIQIALKDNVDLLVARTMLEDARARILSAKAYPNPEVGVEMGADAPSRDDRSITIGFEQPISIRNKIAKRIDLATMDLERDEWFVRDLKRSIAAEVRRKSENPRSIRPAAGAVFVRLGMYVVLISTPPFLERMKHRLMKLGACEGP